MKKCAYCKKEVQDEVLWKRQSYCSRKCLAEHRIAENRKRRLYDENRRKRGKPGPGPLPASDWIEKFYIRRGL